MEDVFIISGATGEGVTPLLDAVLEMLDEDREEDDADDSDGEATWSPI